MLIINRRVACSRVDRIQFVLESFCTIMIFGKLDNSDAVSVDRKPTPKTTALVARVGDLQRYSPQKRRRDRRNGFYRIVQPFSWLDINHSECLARAGAFLSSCVLRSRHAGRWYVVPTGCVHYSSMRHAIFVLSTTGLWGGMVAGDGTRRRQLGT